jgi:hypothetical protein
MTPHDHLLAATAFYAVHNHLAERGAAPSLYRFGRGGLDPDRFFFHPAGQPEVKLAALRAVQAGEEPPPPP